MKETIFENKIIYTKECYKEVYKYFCFKRPAIIAMYIILGMNLILGILSEIIPQLVKMDSNSIIFDIIMIIIMLSIQIISFYNKQYIAYKNDLDENNGKPIEFTILITDENIEFYRDSTKVKNIQLGDINKVFQTKNYYVLGTKTGVKITINKNEFTKGTLTQFKEFLNKYII